MRGRVCGKGGIGRMKIGEHYLIDLVLLGYRHYSYEINLIYILQFSLAIPPSIDIPTTVTRIRKVMENQLLSSRRTLFLFPPPQQN